MYIQANSMTWEYVDTAIVGSNRIHLTGAGSGFISKRFSGVSGPSVEYRRSFLGLLWNCNLLLAANQVHINVSSKGASNSNSVFINPKRQFEIKISCEYWFITAIVKHTKVAYHRISERDSAYCSKPKYWSKYQSGNNVRSLTNKGSGRTQCVVVSLTWSGSVLCGVLLLIACSYCL